MQPPRARVLANTAHQHQWIPLSNHILTVNDERLWIIHLLDIYPQMECLEAPPLPMCNRLPRGRDVCFREEETTEPNLEVTKRRTALVRNTCELTQAAGEVRDPLGDRRRARHLVFAPMSRNRTYVVELHRGKNREETVEVPFVSEEISSRR